MTDDTTAPTFVEKLKPSASSTQSLTIGAPLTVIMLFAVKQIWPSVEITPEVAGAFGVLVSALCGYFFPGGKSYDVA